MSAGTRLTCLLSPIKNVGAHNSTICSQMQEGGVTQSDTLGMSCNQSETAGGGTLSEIRYLLSAELRNYSNVTKFFSFIYSVAVCFTFPSGSSEQHSLTPAHC